MSENPTITVVFLAALGLAPGLIWLLMWMKNEKWVCPGAGFWPPWRHDWEHVESAGSYEIAVKAQREHDGSNQRHASHCTVEVPNEKTFRKSACLRCHVVKDEITKERDRVMAELVTRDERARLARKIMEGQDE